jgi:hypothetical protein
MATTNRTASNRGNDFHTGASNSPGSQGGAVRETVNEAASAVQESGKNLAAKAKDQAQSYFADKKDEVRATLTDLAEAARQVARTLRERNDVTVSRYTESAADRVEEFAHYVQDLEPRRLMRTLEDTARRQPALFYGGLFVAGLAISRFLHATTQSGDGGRHHTEDHEYQLASGPRRVK